MSPGGSTQPHVEQLKLGISNVYVVYGERPILIDTSTPSEFDDLTQALQQLHVEPGKLALLVVTHCHADHAGGAKQLRDAWKSPVALGTGDAPACAEGQNRTLHPMSAMASVLKPFIVKKFSGFKADYRVSDTMDLRPFGVAGQIIAMPGHTPGSVVVLLDDGDAFIGDLFAGGRLGGRIRPTRPQTHYYHEDQQRAEAAVCTLIERGAKRLYLGHGGPVTATKAWDRFCKGDRRP